MHTRRNEMRLCRIMRQVHLNSYTELVNKRNSKKQIERDEQTVASSSSALHMKEDTGKQDYDTVLKPQARRHIRYNYSLKRVPLAYRDVKPEEG